MDEDVDYIEIYFTMFYKPFIGQHLMWVYMFEVMLSYVIYSTRVSSLVLLDGGNAPIIVLSRL